MAAIQTHIDPELAQLLLSQLRHRGQSNSETARKADISSSAVTVLAAYGRDYDMDNEDWNKLVSYLRVEMERAGRKGHPFLLTKEEFRQAVGNSRAGTHNRPDPAAKRLIHALFDDWRERGFPDLKTYSKEVGLPRATIAGYFNGIDNKDLPKTIFRRTREVIESYLDRDKTFLPEVDHADPLPNPTLYWAEDKLNPDVKVSKNLVGVETFSAIQGLLVDLPLSDAHAVIRALVAWHQVTI